MSGYTKDSLYSKLLRISADHRLPGQGGDRTTNFVIDLGANLQRCKRLSIQSINFPNNFYNVFNNSFNGQYNNIGYFSHASNPNTFTIAPGFYNTAQLMSAITTAFNTAASGDATITSFTQDPISGICSFTYNSATSVSTLIEFEKDNKGNPQPSPFSLLGFTGFANTLASPTTVTATKMPSLCWSYRSLHHFQRSRPFQLL